MAFQKCECIDGQTVITAELLNRIQDAICNLETSVESLPESDPDSAAGGVFVAIYGTTTNAEMWAAHQAGELVLCYDAGTQNIFSVFNITETKAWFSGYAANSASLASWVCENDAWSAGASMFAPGGYGLGENNMYKLKLITTTEDLNDISENGLYGYDGPELFTGALGGIIRAENASELYRTQWYTDLNGHRLTRNYVYGSGWLPWDWENPPLEDDVEYRTTDRISGKAVYKKKTATGDIMYRLDGETAWSSYAAIVGARPNTWLPTASEIGAAPGIESGSYPKCYYRIVDGVYEWLNPPMVLGTEYRTTERHNGAVVYTKLVNCGVNTNGATIAIDTSISVIRYVARATNKVAYPFHNPGSDYYREAMVSSGGITLLCGTKASGVDTVYCQIWYTK